MPSLPHPHPPTEARPADLPPGLLWLVEEPAVSPPPPPVLTRCPRCHGPLIVWHGTPVCENCDTVELPETDDWLREDDCGRA